MRKLLSISPVKERVADSTGEILILPDGKIMAHNISPALAKWLAELNPADEAMRQRANPHKSE